MQLADFLRDILAGEKSPSMIENKAMAVKLFAEQELGITDIDVLHDFFDQVFDLFQPDFVG